MVHGHRIFLCYDLAPYRNRPPEFHARAFERGCSEYQIDLQHRPPGTPRYGGHVERLIGTMMGAVHLLPGSSFDDTTGRLHMPVVALQMVSGPDETRFYRRILAAVGSPEPPRATLAVLESLALRLLTELRPKMLVIDEIHSLQAGTIREQARFLNMLRFLGNELRIPLVCVGTGQARNALRTDDQLVRRFEAFALSPWQEGADFTGMMSTLMRVCRSGAKARSTRKR